MKMKNIKDIARRNRFKYIAVDANLDIYLYYNLKPSMNSDRWVSSSNCQLLGVHKSLYLGKYTGKKSWTDTLTEVLID